VIFGDSPLAGRTLMSASPSRGPVTFASLLREECTVLTSTTIARRRALLDAGLFDERFLRCEDFHLWLQMLLRGARLAYNRRVLVRHRRREGSLAHDTTAMVRAFVDVIEDLDERLPLSAGERALVREHAARRRAEIALIEARHRFVAGHYAAAAAALDRARTLAPSRLTRVRLGAIRAGVRFVPRLLHWAYGRLRPHAMPS
jgi:hypothetical protein